MESKDIQNNVLKAIDTIATRRIGQLELDKTVTAIIKNNVGIFQGRKIYKVQYDGGFFNATAQNADDAYLPGMAVYVSIPQGNFSNEKFIIGRTSSLATNEQKSAVAALVNNYGIVGTNNISVNAETSFGVRSYHSIEEEREKEGEELNAIISHRYNLLYKYDENETEEERKKKDIKVDNTIAQLHTKDANAIMFRADFMNTLSSEQKAKASGEFGLVFNLAFKNKAYDIGETQGEIFDHYAKIIQTENVQDDGSIVLSSLASIDSLIQEVIGGEKGTVEEVVATDTGILDQASNDILTLTTAFALNNTVLYDDLADAIVKAYLRLIEELRVCKSFNRQDNKDGMSELYESWRETKIKEPKEKIVSYYLSSNSMIGNPFYFSSWISQYEVFEADLESFIRLDSIILYKEGFKQDSVTEKMWPPEVEDGGPDIFVRNLQMYFMKPVADYNGSYQLKVESGKKGRSDFLGNEADDYKLTLRATFFRELYEDLTYNQDTKFYWFKSDANIISPNQEEYSIYGGLGWAEIPNNNSYKLSITKQACPAYENHFRCVVVYSGEETPIILRYDYIIYNKAGRQFVLSSDIGENFGFDAGNPVLTLLTRTGEEEFEEVNDSSYKFKWYLINNNAQKVYLLKNTTELSFQNVANFAQIMGQTKLLNNIEFFKGEDKLTNPDNYDMATRIKYPMSNLGDASTVTFEVYIEETSNEGNSFTLGKASLTLSNIESVTLGDYRLEIEGGDQVFQYDEYGNAPNSKKFKDPLQVQPLRAKLFNASNLEIADANFWTKWYFPIGESMIEYDKNSAKYDPTTGENRIFEGPEVAFKIADGYNPNTTDNNIYCVVTLGEKTFSKYTTLLFTKVGENGTNGTDMVAKIVPTSKSADLNEQPVMILNYKDGDVWKSCFNYEHGFNIKDILKEEQIIAADIIPAGGLADNYPLKAQLYQKSQEVVLNSGIKWNIAGNTSTANNKIGKYLEIYSEDTSDGKISGIKWNKNPPEKGFANPYLQSIIKAEINYGEGTYYAFYTLPSIDYYIEIPNLTKNRIGIRNDAYLKEIIYNSDGRNPKYNHSQGLELLNIPDECYIEWEACGGYNSENKIPLENEPTFKLLPEAKASKKEAKREIKPTTDEEGNIYYPSNMVYVLPDDSISGNITNNYIKATIKNKADNEIIAVVHAPISFSLNTFGLASINAWDGNSISLDDENGAVLAPQVGAGKKDSNNKFTGILMGDALDCSELLQDDYEAILKTDYKNAPVQHLTGLFGISEGVRSLFLDAETGQAIFGKPNLKDENGKEIDKIKVWNSETGKYEEQENYNEGQIKLIPGGTSVVGGWRLGRHSLYYTSSGQIGGKYKDEWAENHHEKDIKHEDQGVLISANPSYISIKGRVLKSGEIKEDNEDNQIEEGDSLELQLDPANLTMFGIFRHHNKNSADKEKDPSYERLFLSGINRKGQLVANKMEQTPAKANQTSTSLGIENLNAFGEDNYVGLNLEAGANLNSTVPFFRAFVNKEEMKNNKYNTPVYITGGQNSSKNSDYNRPISIHGAEIFLYAKDSSSNNETKTTTDANFKISKDSSSLQLGDKTQLKLYRNNSKDNNELKTANGFNIAIGSGANPPDKEFNLKSGTQNIGVKGNYLLNVTENVETISETGSIAMHRVVSKTGDGKIDKEAAVKISDNTLELLVPPTNSKDNKIILTNKTGANDTSLITAATGLKIISSSTTEADGPLWLEGAGKGLQGSLDNTADIVLKAGERTTLRLSSYADNQTSYPFYLDLDDAGKISVDFNATADSDLPLEARMGTFLVSMNGEFGAGVFINGHYQGTNNGLQVNYDIQSVMGGIYANGTVRGSNFEFNTNPSPSFFGGTYSSGSQQSLYEHLRKIWEVIGDLDSRTTTNEENITDHENRIAANTTNITNNTTAINNEKTARENDIADIKRTTLKTGTQYWLKVKSGSQPHVLYTDTRSSAEPKGSYHAGETFYIEGT